MIYKKYIIKPYVVIRNGYKYSIHRPDGITYIGSAFSIAHAKEVVNDDIEAEAQKALTEKISNLLKSHGLTCDFLIDGPYVEVSVNMGDWKHDHINLKNAMRDAGYVLIDRHIPDTEENSGDDSFSAVYLFHI